MFSGKLAITTDAKLNSLPFLHLPKRLVSMLCMYMAWCLRAVLLSSLCELPRLCTAWRGASLQIASVDFLMYIILHVCIKHIIRKRIRHTDTSAELPT